MSLAFIILGDTTSHGGVVISASPFSSGVLGKGIARQGDMVSCPRCKGVFPISEGHAAFIVDGAPLAYHGCHTACGAMLISSQQVTTTTLFGGAAMEGDDSDETPPTSSHYGAINNELSAGYENTPLDHQNLRFKGRFQVIHESTGLPIGGLKVRISCSDGQQYIDETDANGYTQWIERDSAETIALDLMDEAAT